MMDLTEVTGLAMKVCEGSTCSIVSISPTSIFLSGGDAWERILDMGGRVRRIGRGVTTEVADYGFGEKTKRTRWEQQNVELDMGGVLVWTARSTRRVEFDSTWPVMSAERAREIQVASATEDGPTDEGFARRFGLTVDQFLAVIHGTYPVEGA